MDLLTIYSRANRKTLLAAAAVLTCVIAIVDWYTRPFISIGFLYLFPMMLISGIFRRWQIVVASVVCAIFQELYSNLPFETAIPRLVFSWIGFASKPAPGRTMSCTSFQQKGTPYVTTASFGNTSTVQVENGVQPLSDRQGF